MPASRVEPARVDAALAGTIEVTRGRVARGDRAFRLLALLSAACLPVLLAGIGVQMWLASGLSLHRFGFLFLISSVWNPVKEQFGGLPFIYGTAVTTAVAVILAAPGGVAIAIYLAEMAPSRLRAVLSAIVELLAAIPSVVIGLWGIFIFIPWLRAHVEAPLSARQVPLFTGPPYGPGMLAAGLILALMVVPTIAAISRDAFLALPDELRDAALALGWTRWEAIRLVLLPAARVGIVGSIGLGLGRAMGETMATTMVIGNTPQIKASLLATGYSLPAVIANEFTEASTPMYLSALMEVALLLFLITLVVNVVGHLLVGRLYR